MVRLREVRVLLALDDFSETAEAAIADYHEVVPVVLAGGDQAGSTLADEHSLDAFHPQLARRLRKGGDLTEVKCAMWIRLLVRYGL